MNDFEWPAESEFEELAAAPLLAEEPPPDHRSGFVAVIGRPNVGKSTLLNHILGQKIAIVSHKPQTTRNQLLGILTLPALANRESLPDRPPAQILFVDTPGIHKPHHKLGEYLVEAALEAIADADIILWLVDAAKPPTQLDQLVANSLHRARSKAKRRHTPFPPVLLGLNKIDRLSPAQRAGLEQSFLTLYPGADWLTLSATQGHNLAELLDWLVAHLPPGPRYYPEDQVTDQQTRFIAAELIREAALEVLRQEVPHALAVQVTDFKRRHQNLVYIGANLIIERSSQKKIVIGQNGQTLKQIGQLARPQIEELVDSKVYLELWVKVRPKWRKKQNDLRWLGYSLK